VYHWLGLFLDSAQPYQSRHRNIAAVCPWMEQHRKWQPTRLLRLMATATATLTWRLRSSTWATGGDLLHFSARSLCKPFHILEGRQVLFQLRIPATLVLADFWYNARRQKGPAIRSTNMREGQRDELFRTGLHSVLEVSSLELLNQQSTCCGHTLFDIS
jgi:hypothetical protein